MGWWALWTMGWLWRRTLWQRIGTTACNLVGRDGVKPLFLGWRVEIRGVRIDWRGGWQGPHTLVRRGKERTRYEGLLTEAQVHEAMRS